MLPGLTRTAAQPASIAAKTYLGWKWMSAITGICDLLAIAGSASASSWLGTATRTIWQPDAVSSAICCRVALMSAVSVVVIDCTRDRRVAADRDGWWVPSTILRLARRGASTGGGSGGHAESDGHAHHPLRSDRTPPTLGSTASVEPAAELQLTAAVRPGAHCNVMGFTMSA